MMKKLLSLGVFLVSLGALAAPNDPAKYQYWFDNDQSNRVSNTKGYVSDPIEIDISGLSEGGHSVTLRMADADDNWGGVVSKKFYIPVSYKATSITPSAYRLYLNNSLISNGEVPAGDSFDLELNAPEEVELSNVRSRDFIFLQGEERNDDVVQLTADGSYSFALQVKSDLEEWGAPLIQEIDDPVVNNIGISDLSVVPMDIKFDKVSNNLCYAFRFKNPNSTTMFLRSSQDCKIRMFYIDGENLYDLDERTLKKDEEELQRFDSFWNRDYEILAVVYDTPVNNANPDDSILLRLMFAEDKLPTPEIIVNNDNWEVTLTCADERAKIFYKVGDGEFTEYTAPFILDGYTTIEAYAESIGEKFDGLDPLPNSDNASLTLSYQNMRIPAPQLNYVGGEKYNEYTLTNAIEGVTTYYTLDGHRPQNETYRKEYKGEILTIEDGTYLWAYSAKDGFTQTSPDLQKTVEKSTYITDQPEQRMDWNSYTQRNDILKLRVPYNTKVYYRVVPGKLISKYDDQIDPSEWTEYIEDNEIVQSNGDPLTGNMTVQAFAESEGKLRSIVLDIYTEEWIKADKPVVAYDNYQVKLSTEVPGGSIWYWFNGEDSDAAREYSDVDFPDGINIKEQQWLYAYVKAEGYQDSDRVDVYTGSYNLGRPSISYNETDEQIEISTSDLDATIVPVFYTITKTPDENNEGVTVTENVLDLTCTPIRDEENNKNMLTCKVPNNTYVKAYVKKEGSNDSEFATLEPNSVPNIRINEYTIEVDDDWNWRGRLYYTFDGSDPTKDVSMLYNNYDGRLLWDEEGPRGCTLKYTVIGNGRVPSDGEPLRVYEPAAAPEIEFNFSNITDENSEEQQQIRKVKFSTATENSEIYYSFDYWQDLDDWYKYSDDADSEGIEVGDNNEIYAFASATDDYRRSDKFTYNLRDGQLSAPQYEISDNKIRIWHNDKNVTIVPTFEPEHDYTYDEENNEITCEVAHNTNVKAKVERKGYLSSSLAELPVVEKPTVNISDYEVWFDHHWQATVHYTLDGTVPSRESTQYDDNSFVADSCQVRAVAFRDGYIPAESNFARVLHRASTPNIEFNFSNVDDGEGGTTEVHKVKFNCPTDKSTVYYRFDRWYGDWNKYDESENPEGIDVGDNSNIYAYANGEDYRDSETVDFNLRDARLSAPSMSVSNDTVRIWHNDKSVSLVPIFTPAQEYEFDEEANEITCKVSYNTVVKALASKKGYLNSDTTYLRPVSAPTIQIDGYRVWFDKDWDASVYYTLDGTMPTKESSYYDNEAFETDSCRVRAVAFKDGYIPAEANSRLVRHQAAVPTIVFNYDKVKFYCATKDAPISYRLNNQYDWHSYDPAETPDGIEFGDASYVYVVAEETEFYRRSDETRYYMNEANLSQPHLEYKDGVVRIWHDDKDVKIVPTFTPAHEYSYDEEKNEITCAVAYNTIVTAHAEKDGYINSSETESNQILSDKPTITTGDSDYSFYINDSGNGYIYYTLDGSMPTADSKYYDGNWVYTDNKACTVRAVRFNDGRIPAESTAKVMDRVPNPVVEFNFSKVMESEPNENGESTEVEKEIKKITFSCEVPGAKITYKLNNKMDYEVFDPVADADGIDVSETSYLYAYAEADGYRRSEEVYTSMDDVNLPEPQIAYYWEDNTVQISHSRKGVTIVPTFYKDTEENVFVPEDLTYDKEKNIYTCTVPYNTHVRAYAEKAGSYTSSTAYLDPVDKPTINLNDFRVSIDYYWRTEAYYTADGSMPTKQSTRYVESFDTVPCTIRAVAFRDGYIPSEADSVVVLNKCANPKIVYNFDRATDRRKVKMTCDTPDAKIYWAFSDWDLNNGEKNLYDPEVDSEGVNVANNSYIYAYAELDGYRKSDNVGGSLSNAYLNAPNISVTSEGVEIYHNDPTVNIVTTLYTGSEDNIYEPADFVYTRDQETNKITFTPKYNTVVVARAEKPGYYASYDETRYPLNKPRISVDGYRVSMDHDYWSDAEIYYTCDGSMPTKESTLYEAAFDTIPCTIRAVLYYGNDVPSEADSVKVMHQCSRPEIIFNFDRASERKKVKLSSPDANARIYYTFSEWDLNYGTRYLYDEDKNPDGIDVDGHSYIYANAEVPGFRRSESSSRYINEAYLSEPSISFLDDTKMEISLNNSDADIVATFYIPSEDTYYTPEDLDYVNDGETKKMTFTVKYNTIVKAYAEKTGYYTSSTTERSTYQTPTISVDGYYVYIDNNWYGETYYTTDGSMPTKESYPYTGGFETTAGTIRAVLFVDGYVPAEAEKAQVMDQAAAPVVEIENTRGKLVSSTPNAVIYYTIDEPMSISKQKVYSEADFPNGIDLSTVKTINAYAEATGYRRSENLNFSKTDHQLDAPMLSYSNSYVVADHEDDDVTVKFTDGNGKELTPDANNARRVKVDYNTTVNAYSYKKGHINSSSVQLKSTDVPTLTADLFTVTIKSKSGQTVHYTTDGTLPTLQSKAYTGPFSVTESCKVRAVAFVDDLIPAEGASIDIAYRKSLKPEVKSYDGRYLTLKAEDGSSIKYVIGQNENINNGTVATGKIDLQGINVIKAIAQRSDADDSEEFTYTPEYYADEENVYTSKAGVLNKAFDWCGDKSIYTSLSVHGPILGTAIEDNGDYAFLLEFPALRHLDLSNVTDAAVPAGAFNSKNLLSVVMPSNLKTAGELLFGEDNSTLCSVELPGTGFAPANLLDGVKNPNLLLYVKTKNLVNDLIEQSPDVTNNVILLGTVNGSNRAENVSLVHASAFYAPKEFTAQKISYTRAFTKETQIGGFGSGWETMVVPFNVQTINCGDKVCKPFGEAETDRGECPFWLFSGAETDWMAETSVMANTPYLLAFPNNPLYAEEYVVNGDVVFSASNVSVPITPEEDDMMFGFGPSRYIVGNYQTIDKEENVLALNDEVYTYLNNDFQPGGIFVAGQKDVVPFECFVWSDAGPSALPVFEQSAIDEIFGDTGVKIWSESYDIYIHSGVAMKVRIYDTVGQLVRSVNVKAGETVRVQDITPGIYFVGNYKLLVKK